ncbi:MAG: Trm112 family protein [Candidatus Promineifilaceae bacterium]
MPEEAMEASISPEFVDLLRCPQAVHEQDKYGPDAGRLRLVHGCWLVSDHSGLKYPVRDGIPTMFIEEGEKWKDTAEEDLPVPPPV